MEVLEHAIYTPEETESLLKISRSTFLRLIKRGVLQARKVGGQYRILGEEILRMVKPKLAKERRPRRSE
ncbi:MAG: helix-turn-helix domain-containing protein [Desulfotomaculaceae bacterium]